MKPTIPRLLLAAALLLTTAGCSRIAIVYNTSGFFIEQYAQDYLGLDGDQLAAWRPALSDALARHRREELPYLAAFFDDLHRGATEGFDAAEVRCLLDQLEGLYRRHFRIAAGLSAPLLAALDRDQIRDLERRFREENEDAPEEDAASIARRDRKRAERYAESAEWWVGPLTETQRTIIAEVTAAMPDTAADWVAYRAARQRGLVRLLEAGADEARIRRYLDDWLVEHRDLPPSLERARLEIRRRIVELFLHMDASFSPEQRAHFAGRLADLRDDFLNLQRTPHSKRIPCASSD